MLTNLIHTAGYPWQYVNCDNVVQLTVQAMGPDVQAITCIACDPCDTYRGNLGQDVPRLREVPMVKRISSPGVTYFSCVLPLRTHKLRYHFLVHTTEATLLYDESGLSPTKDELFIRPFFVAYTYPADHTYVPAWCNGMVWYQIFPDRFAKTPGGGEHWETGHIADKNLVCGGTLKGIAEKVSYLKQHGVSGIYLNPIFAASSIHRYDTVDYYAIDPRLGTEDDFVSFCDLCHENGIRVMLDGVFNHCSSSAPQFEDVCRSGRNSKFYDWFTVYDPERILHFTVPKGADSEFKESPLYETFAFVPSMPKFNTTNPQVMDHLIGAAEYWTKKCHIDAWRLDVPDEINIAFLREFKRRLKSIDPDIYIIGEIWGDATPWLREEVFDGAMDYPTYFIIRDFLAYETIDAFRCAELLAKRIMSCPEDRRRGSFHFCSTHDTPRILWHCQEDEARAGLCYILTAAIGDSLSIYYGDEIGMTGGYDPDNRRCFPWGAEKHSSKVGAAIQDAISLLNRKSSQQITRIYAVDTDMLCITYETFCCLINRSSVEKKVYDITLQPLSYSFVE